MVRSIGTNMPRRRATARVDQYKEVRAALAEANAGDFASPRAINAVARKWRVTARAKARKFQKDLLASTRQMRRGQAGRVTKVKLPAAAEARASVGLSQQAFAELLGVSARTLQDWEQGRREPTGAARTLLKVAVKHPKLLRAL